MIHQKGVISNNSSVIFWDKHETILLDFLDMGKTIMAVYADLFKKLCYQKMIEKQYERQQFCKKSIKVLFSWLTMFLQFSIV